MALKIGITERGDGGLDLSWAEKMSRMDGAIIITKNLNDNCIENLLEHKGKVVLHCGCTGMGGTPYEPNVPSPTWQMNQLAKLIRMGFDPSHVVLRIDPIIPTPEGIVNAKGVLQTLQAMQQSNQIPDIRIRVSIIDMYPHVRERFKAAGLPCPYGENFYAPAYMTRNVTAMLKQFPYTYETCAEKYLTDSIYKAVGCVSETDVRMLIKDPDSITSYINPQNRSGCLCLGCKTEMLENKKQCPHRCLYCYWRNNQ